MSDVESALRLNDTEVTVIPVSPSPQSNPLAIRRDAEASHAAVGRQINQLGCDVVLIQHEFGIYGGDAVARSTSVGVVVVDVGVGDAVAVRELPSDLVLVGDAGVSG